MRYHLTLVRIKNTKTKTKTKKPGMVACIVSATQEPEAEGSLEFRNLHKCWLRCKQKGILISCRQKCKLVQRLERAVEKVLKKQKIALPYDPAILLMGLYPKKSMSAYKEHNS